MNGSNHCFYTDGAEAVQRLNEYDAKDEKKNTQYRTCISSYEKYSLVDRSQHSIPSNDSASSTHARPEQSILTASPKFSTMQREDLVQQSNCLLIQNNGELLNCIGPPELGEALHEEYTDEPSMLYGYVAAPNMGLSNIHANPKFLTSMPLILDVSLSRNETNSPIGKAADIYNKAPNIGGHVSDLQVRHLPITASQMPDEKELYVRDDANPHCAATRWRAPNLSEVIYFLNNPNNAIKANAAAYLQHLCYMDDPNKQRTRSLGGIPLLVQLLSNDAYEVYKNACGALRNLSYGRQNDENKRAIKNAGGITALINLLYKSEEIEVKELVTGVLWNLSSCEDLKRTIIDDGLDVIVMKVIKPNSGWDPVCPSDMCSSNVFRNASGILRNVSSAGEYARKKLRNSDYLIECLLHVLRSSIEKNIIGTKIVENCVCILRNLSYRCQEEDDPNYDKVPMATTVTVTKGENLGCFGSSRKKKEVSTNHSNPAVTAVTPNTRGKAYEKLWHPEVIHYYLALLQSCSNPETLEAAAGSIQNLSACYWQPSIDIRATVRKEKGLPILVELLRMEVDRVVCAVATALRNLAIDQRNKELIGKYAMRDLIQKLPSTNQQHDLVTSDETITAVLATINEVIKKNPEFARTLVEADGIERLINITRDRQHYSPCVIKFADQVLLTLWQHAELRDVYKKNGWKESDFISKYVSVRNTEANSPNNANSTLNRPMASQGRTRYEDKTVRRTPHSSGASGDAQKLPIILNQSIYTKTQKESLSGLTGDHFHTSSSDAPDDMYSPTTRSDRNYSK